MDEGLWHLNPELKPVRRDSRFKRIRYRLDSKVSTACEDVFSQLTGPKNMTKTGFVDIIPFRKFRSVSLALFCLNFGVFF